VDARAEIPRAAVPVFDEDDDIQHVQRRQHVVK
jgi:hypothetical protein